MYLGLVDDVVDVVVVYQLMKVFRNCWKNRYCNMWSKSSVIILALAGVPLLLPCMGRLYYLQMHINTSLSFD